ncbi:hypothetical protein LshimejAT787_1402410 [Lyophyllum shimeji]|uniref:Uncharacterized protein n=1 Tax=Lyophyllum shimeji TaxID=47721 RepID=A0A9P3PY56_LYOSH|nr:hypothetical protein LshimejAT787_1402410 [Lyophyllum shimeji]
MPGVTVTVASFGRKSIPHCDGSCDSTSDKGLEARPEPTGHAIQVHRIRKPRMRKHANGEDKGPGFEVIKSCAAYLEGDDSLDIRNLDLDCSPHIFRSGYLPKSQKLVPFKEEDHKIDGAQVRSMLWLNGGVTPTLCLTTAVPRDGGGLAASIAKMTDASMTKVTDVANHVAAQWKVASRGRRPSITSSQSSKVESSSTPTVTASASGKSIVFYFRSLSIGKSEIVKTVQLEVEKHGEIAGIMTNYGQDGYRASRHGVLGVLWGAVLRKNFAKSEMMVSFIPQNALHARRHVDYQKTLHDEIPVLRSIAQSADQVQDLDEKTSANDELVTRKKFALERFSDGLNLDQREKIDMLW